MTESKGLVSIVIPAYNAENFIRETLLSIASQDYIAWEIIVVNDGSSDHTAKIAMSISHLAVLLINQENAGVSSARNTGFANANGEFICFFDADDLMTTDFLSTRVNALRQNGNIDFVGGYIESFPIKQPVRKAVAEDPETQIHFFDPNVATIPSNYLFRASVLRESNISFNPLLNSSADRFFLLELAKYSKGSTLPDEKGKLLYRISESSMSHHITPKLTFDYFVFYKELNAQNLLPQKNRTKIKSMYLFSLASSFSLVGYWGYCIKHFFLSFFTNPLVFLRLVIKWIFKRPGKKKE
jgi:glycosyltransferase involved in cell wall biosynthesis